MKGWLLKVIDEYQGDELLDYVANQISRRKEVARQVQQSLSQQQEALSSEKQLIEQTKARCKKLADAAAAKVKQLQGDCDHDGNPCKICGFKKKKASGGGQEQDAED